MGPVIELTNDKQNKWKAIIATIIIAVLIVGFLANRVVSNVGFLLAGIYALWHIRSLGWLFKNQWMWTFMLMALVPLISDIIVDGSQFYMENGIMKCLLILFPAFVFAFKPNQKYISIIHYIVIISMSVATFYSIVNYGLNMSKILEGYKYSKVMKVLSYSDHIRISWVIVISMIMAMYEIVRKPERWLKSMLVVYIIIQALFIHFLGSKTGLLMMYISIMVYFAWILPKGKKWLLGVLPLLLAIFFIVAVNTIPSLKERVNYIRYDFSHYIKGEYRDGLSDAVRFYSIKAGISVMKDHWPLGAGFSRMRAKAGEWYDANLPEMNEASRFPPISEFIVYAAGGGLIGLMVILAHTLYPFFNRHLRKNVWLMTYFIPAVFSFTYETHLEGQLPLFVYAFFTSWFWYIATKIDKS